VKFCFYVSSTSDRITVFTQARLRQQARQARRNFLRRGPRRLQAVLRRLPAEGVPAIAELTTFSQGCRYLAANFGKLMTIITLHCYLPPDELGVALFLQGIPYSEDSLFSNSTAYRMHLLNLGATPGGRARRSRAGCTRSSVPRTW
jgi:hypothetical protein